MRSPARHRWIPFLAVIAILITFSGCDAASTETVVLGDIRAEFQFEFDGGTLATGQLRSVSSTQNFNIAQKLSELGGFTPSEIVSGEVKAASVDLFSPPFVNLSGISQVILQLRSGSTTLEVASRSGFANEEPAALTVIRNRDIAGILSAGSFDAVLQVQAGTIDVGMAYDLAVVLTLSVEVEGV